jgi:RNA polymerase sigma-70 factor (ECF subfamily)
VNPSDEELMAELRLGSDQAFAEFYDRYARRLQHFFYRGLNKDEELASDFVHDLFLKLIEVHESFMLDRSLKTWLFSIANNMLINEYKKRAVRNRELKVEIQTTVSANGHYRNHDESHFRESLEKVIKGFDRETQRLFFFRFKEEMSVAEIAEVMALKEGTVKSRLHYLMKKLSKELKEFKDLGAKVSKELMFSLFVPVFQLFK